MSATVKYATMGPKSVPCMNPLIKKVRNMIDINKELVAKHESGVHVAYLARMNGKSAPTISSILTKKKESRKLMLQKE